MRKCFWHWHTLKKGSKNAISLSHVKLSFAWNHNFKENSWILELRQKHVFSGDIKVELMQKIMNSPSTGPAPYLVYLKKITSVYNEFGVYRGFMVKILIIGQIFDFWPKVFVISQNIDFWAKFWLLSKILICKQNFDFWATFRFLSKISIFEPNFNF